MDGFFTCIILWCRLHLKLCQGILDKMTITGPPVKSLLCRALGYWSLLELLKFDTFGKHPIWLFFRATSSSKDSTLEKS